MAKTQNELKEIKKEFDSLMNSIKELNDEELKEVTGGEYYVNEYHDRKEDASYLFNIGEEVEVRSGWFFGTVRCRVIDRKIVKYTVKNSGAPGLYLSDIDGYRDEYQIEEIESHWYFYMNKEWVPRSEIEVRKKF